MIKGNVAKVYGLFLAHKHLTDMQIQNLLKDINPNSIRPCRLKLERLGLIVRTKNKIKHINNSKRGTYTIYSLANFLPENQNNNDNVENMKTIENSILELSKIFNNMATHMQKIINICTKKSS